MQLDLIAQSQAMQQLLAKARRFAPTRAPVLLLGETGTGKEVLARYVHEYSGRERFVAVDCGALPEELFASEAFGYRRGAFTGASRDHPGLLAYASGGTLFLDEVGNASPRMQAQLLRVLQEGTVRPLGALAETRLDLRVISATNVDLAGRVREGTFREDLFYRLNTILLHVPPLRERRDDILPLAQAILRALSVEYDSRKSLSEGMTAFLLEYDFPGNVRELEHLLHRAHLATDSPEIGTETIEYATPTQLISRAPSFTGDFWTSVAKPYLERRLTRKDVQALLHDGLTRTKGSYRQLLAEFGMPNEDYKRFMDFLRRHGLSLDFRPYRRDERPI